MLDANKLQQAVDQTYTQFHSLNAVSYTHLTLPTIA